MKIINKYENMIKRNEIKRNDEFEELICDESYKLWVYEYFIEAYRAKIPVSIIRDCAININLPPSYKRQWQTVNAMITKAFISYKLKGKLKDRLLNLMEDGQENLQKVLIIENGILWDRKKKQYIFNKSNVETLASENISKQLKDMSSGSNDAYICYFNSDIVSDLIKNPVFFENNIGYLSLILNGEKEKMGWGEYQSPFLKNSSRIRNAIKNKIPYEEYMANGCNCEELLKSEWGELLDKYWKYDEDIEQLIFEHNEDKDKVKTIDKMGIKATADITSYIRKSFISKNKNFANIYFSKSNRVEFGGRESPDYQVRKTNIYKVGLSCGGGIFIARGNDKYRPASLKEVLKMLNSSGNPLFRNFIMDLVDYYISKGYYNAKTLKSYIENGVFIIPGDMSDLLKTHNNKEIMSKYNPCRNPNKYDLNLLYAISKSLPYVTEESKGVLANITDSRYIYDIINNNSISFRIYKNNIYRNGITLFLANIIKERLLTDKNISRYIASIKRREKTREEKFFTGEESNEMADLIKDIKTQITDYVVDCILNKKKVNLRFNSIRKLKDKHRRMSEEKSLEDYLNSNTKVKVPSNSKFNKLREILPKEFEWLKTKERLAQEGAYMSHCVFNYSQMINSDRCAIYSFIYEPDNKRYTCEFRLSNNGYMLNQIQSKRDRGASSEVKEYIKSLLKNQNKNNF